MINYSTRGDGIVQVHIITDEIDDDTGRLATYNENFVVNCADAVTVLKAVRSAVGEEPLGRYGRYGDKFEIFLSVEVVGWTMENVPISAVWNNSVKDGVGISRARYLEEVSVPDVTDRYTVTKLTHDLLIVSHSSWMSGYYVVQYAGPFEEVSIILEALMACISSNDKINDDSRIKVVIGDVYYFIKFVGLVYDE